MAQVTPGNDVRKVANEILKRVDQLIKAGEIDRSIREIIHAKEIDPLNGYVHAYEERLAHLKEEHEKNAAREQTRKLAEEAARKRDAELRSQQEEEQQKRKKELDRQENERKKQEEHNKIEKERPPAEDARAILSKPVENNAPDSRRVDRIKEPLSKLVTIPEQARESSDKHRDAGLSSEQLSRTGAQNVTNQRSTSGGETILVIDDDELMLQLISHILRHHGYEVTSIATSDDAYALLKDWKPMLIVSDIDLKNSTMGGFGLYEKIRTLVHLRDVPFIFLSGMSDEIIIRKGKELGVDDYLTKPVSEENLIAAVKGKLKRYRLLGMQ